MTLRSTGSAVSKGLDPPLLEEAEVLGGGVTAIGLLLFAPLRYPEMLAEADGDFLIASFLFWIMSSCFWRRSLAFSKCFLRSSFDQYLPICKKWMKFYYMSKKSWRTATYELMMKKLGLEYFIPSSVTPTFFKYQFLAYKVSTHSMMLAGTRTLISDIDKKFVTLEGIAISCKKLMHIRLNFIDK